MAESPKIETRLNPLMRQALDMYMSDKHLENESEILRSALGQFLEREGYLTRIAERPGEYRVNAKEEQPGPEQKDKPRAKDKKIGFNNSLKGCLSPVPVV